MIKLLSLFGGGLYGYLIAAAVSAALSVSATYYLVHNANAVEISKLHTQIAETKAASATASLQQLQTFITNMSKAENAYKDAVADITAKYAAISSEFKHAISSHPLPPDCRIDAERLRILSNATAAANHPPALH